MSRTAASSAFALNQCGGAECSQLPGLSHQLHSPKALMGLWEPQVLTSSKPDTHSPISPALGRVSECRALPSPAESGIPRALPSLAHAGLQPAQLFVGLVENVKVSGTPAPPDSQAPLRVFVLKAAHNRVLCYESCVHQRPGEGRREQGGHYRGRHHREGHHRERHHKERHYREGHSFQGKALCGRAALQAQHWLMSFPSSYTSFL